MIFYDLNTNYVHIISCKSIMKLWEFLFVSKLLIVQLFLIIERCTKWSIVQLIIVAFNYSNTILMFNHFLSTLIIMPLNMFLWILIINRRLCEKLYLCFYRYEICIRFYLFILKVFNRLNKYDTISTTTHRHTHPHWANDVQQQHWLVNLNQYKEMKTILNSS